MGSVQNFALVSAILALSAFTAEGREPVRKAVVEKAASLESVRTDINILEKDLLATRESQVSAAQQLRKIRRLLGLQQKEIELSQKKVRELEQSHDELSRQRVQLQENIQKQKMALKTKLRELHRLSQGESLDATWLSDIDAENQKIYFLAKTLTKDLASVERLKQDVLEARISSYASTKRKTRSTTTFKSCTRRCRYSRPTKTYRKRSFARIARVVSMLWRECDRLKKVNASLNRCLRVFEKTIPANDQRRRRLRCVRNRFHPRRHRLWRSRASSCRSVVRRAWWR